MSVTPGQEPVSGAGETPAPTPSPGGNPTQAPNPAPSEIVFTPEQQAVINKLVGQARQEGRTAAQAAKPPVSAPVPTPAPQPEPKITLEDIARELAETKMRARFDKHALRRGLSDEAADDLFDLYRVQKPSDDEQWFGEREKRLGLKQPPSTPPASQTTTTAPVVQVVANTAPISDHGAPAQQGSIGWRYALAHRPMSMTKAEIAQMDAEIGDPDKARKQRLTAANAQAQNLRVVVKPTG